MQHFKAKKYNVWEGEAMELALYSGTLHELWKPHYVADDLLLITVFPQNLTMAKVYFKATFGAVTIRGRLDFKGVVPRL